MSCVANEGYLEVAEDLTVKKDVVIHGNLEVWGTTTTVDSETKEINLALLERIEALEKKVEELTKLFHSAQAQNEK